MAAVANTDQGFKSWATGYGYANQEYQVLAMPNTSFWLASVTKTTVGTLVMKAQEQGKLMLNSKAAEILAMHSAFVWGKGNGNLASVTVEHLAMHTSTIQDGSLYHCSYYWTTHGREFQNSCEFPWHAECMP